MRQPSIAVSTMSLMGPKGDIGRSNEVCFSQLSGHRHNNPACPFGAKSAMRSHPSANGRAGSLNSNFALRAVPSNETPRVAWQVKPFAVSGG